MSLLKLFAIPLLAVTAIAAVTVGRPWYRDYLESADYATPPEGMVLVPAGSFLFGSDDPLAEADERPQRRLFLPAFYIDIYEVTNAEIRKFDSQHTYEAGRGDHPVTGVTLERARAYAEHAGKRLPTRAEWEKAARGTDGRLYPWGNEFESTRANIGNGEALERVGAHPSGVSPYGAHDMVGNAWEWVDDVHRDGGFLRTGTPSVTREIIKGGAYSYASFQGRVSYNGYETVGTTCNDVGFRCAADALFRGDRS